MGESTKTTSIFAERTWLSPDSVQLYLRDYPGASGEARLPVVCLHGLTRNSKDFEEIASTIAATGRRVIVPDVRGRGRSGMSPDPMRYLPAAYARDLIGMLAALGVARAVFLGTSMGGVITMLAAARRNRMVAAAILNDIGPEASPEGLARIAGYAGRPATVSSWDEAAAYVRSINEAAFPNWDDAAWSSFARRTFREDADGGLALDYDPAIRVPILAGKLKAPKFLAWHLFLRLARRRPTLVLRGELSDILSRPIAARMQKAVPAIELVEVGGVGHAPMLDEPDAQASILSFLERAP
ncbi:alpha/beta fold hydrolase [Sphingomonas sp. MAH-20]|uniref:Alpha/beta fold hydrolase n=1 Tax=Sphingomonas horti TaxID=2682842 RepID=A0A6I4J1K6_9SPHN|nr:MULTISPECIES: alpha/beta hydrolase [Sphingomonas]MBA2920585.1 alpha/beta hydrolase [Sphingomonas sp. CGMCC 1.13658]MVO78176.1 alpha/beta fold hydrolase [Sphingomonas horti]